MKTTAQIASLLLAVLVGAVSARAQGGAKGLTLEAVVQRLERLERQNAELVQHVQVLQ